MAFGIHLGFFLVFFAQAEHVASSWSHQGFQKPDGNTHVGFPPKKIGETWRTLSYLQNQFRPADASSPSLQSSGLHGPASVGVSSRRQLGIPGTSQHVRGNFNTVVYPNMAGSPAVQAPWAKRPIIHRLIEDSMNKGDFGLSTAIISGTAINKGHDSAAAHAPSGGDGRKIQFTRPKVSGRPLTGELWKSPKGRITAALPPSTNYGQRSASLLGSGVPHSQTYPEGNRVSTAAPTVSKLRSSSAMAFPSHRVGLRPTSYQKWTMPSPRSYLVGELRSNNGNSPIVKKGYGRSAPALRPPHAGTPKVFAVNRIASLSPYSTKRQNSIAAPRSFTKVGGKDFAPVKTLAIPSRFGGISILRLRDPLKNAGTSVSARGLIF